MGKLIMVLQFLSAISIIVGLHELGHLLFAKLFGIKVESYSIGFPPKIFKFNWRGTEYSLGAIPLGGSVKIAGMVDEYLDNQNIHRTPQPWEFRAKPAWQRLLVILGGILFNLIFGILISIYISFSTGESYLNIEEINKYGITPNELGTYIGFEEGDKLINVNGKVFGKFNDFIDPYNVLTDNSFYTVERQGNLVVLKVPSDFIDKLSMDKKQYMPFITPLIPYVITNVKEGSPADKCGLKDGDSLISIDGVSVLYLQSLYKVLQDKSDKVIELSYMRNGEHRSVEVKVGIDGKLGFVPKPTIAYEHHKYTIMQAIHNGTYKVIEISKRNVLSLGKLITGKISPSKSLSGPIGIAQLFGSSFDKIHFMSMLSVISVILAFTNCLPIPALDGGHAIFIIYEIITGRKISDKFMELMQKIGMVLLLMLAIYTIFNDIYKLFN